MACYISGLHFSEIPGDTTVHHSYDPPNEWPFNFCFEIHDDASVAEHGWSLCSESFALKFMMMPPWLNMAGRFVLKVLL